MTALRWRRELLAFVFCAALLTDCARNPFSRKYEYEEDIYLRLDGSVTIYVNAAVPALVALRGADLPIDPKARLDRQKVRAFYDTSVSHVASVTNSRRDNRRYVHLRVDVPDIRKLSDASPFAWSTYRFDRRDNDVEYRQLVGASASREVGSVGWDGRELAALRLHLPSRVLFHNSPSKTIRRGNIIEWEQPLSDRMKGVMVDIQVRMESESILFRTLSLFGLMAIAVAITFAVVIWAVRRRGSGEPR